MGRAAADARPTGSWLAARGNVRKNEPQTTQIAQKEIF
jgi:hypothetical protein